MSRIQRAGAGRQWLVTVAAVFFVLLTSCPVKGAIKSLAGVPQTTAQGTNKKTKPILQDNSEGCVVDIGADAFAIQNVSAPAPDLTPAALVTAVFVFLAGALTFGFQRHPRYSSVRIPADTPIFLRYRRLII